MALEYALIVSLVIVAMLGGLELVGGSTDEMYDEVGTKVSAAHGAT